MFFDKLCGIAERGHLPSYVRSAVENAKILEFPGRAHEVIPKSGRDESVTANVGGDDFFLPFEETAIEDTATCVVFVNLDPNAQGWSAKRLVIEVAPVSQDNTAEFDTVLARIDSDARARLPRDTFTVTWAEISGLSFDPSNGQFFGIRERASFFFGSKHGPLILPGHPAWRLILTGQCEVLAQNAIVAMKEVAFFNTPDRYVLETTSVDPRTPKHGMIARSDQRPIYQLLTRTEIRAKFGLGDEGEANSHPCPHWRRSHRRTYQHPRFAKSGLLGKTVRIRQTWVGQHEAQVGRRIHRVRLDL